MTPATPHPSDWRTSSYSGNGSACVEVAWSRRTLVRDSKHPHSPELGFPPVTWNSFITHVAHTR